MFEIEDIKTICLRDGTPLLEIEDGKILNLRRACHCSIMFLRENALRYHTRPILFRAFNFYLERPPGFRKRYIYPKII